VPPGQSGSTSSTSAATFPHTDAGGRWTVFNIGGNDFRLVVEVEIVYATHKVFIRYVGTHRRPTRGRRPCAPTSAPKGTGHGAPRGL
jgi:HigB_toxin, RelE-like toxic component of a toxin-antitoxin system